MAHLPADGSSPSPSQAAPEDSPPPPLTEAEERERNAYVDRNLWIAFIGLALFYLAIWST